MATIKSECSAVDRCPLDAVKPNEDPSSFENSCTGLQRFDSPKNNGECAVSVPVLAKQSGGHGGFTCCVPGCFSNNKKNPELSFYNFYNYNFITLLDAFMPVAKSLVYYGSDTDADRLVSGKVEKRGSKRSLSLEQEFFLGLVRLWLGLLEVDLATRAGLSQSQLSRIFITWIDFLHSKLRCYPIWPSRESVHETMPSSFKEMYPTTWVMIDCSELFIETPSSFRTQSITYSNYKHHNTAKGLVGISPSAAVTFVTDLYAGRSSDKQITNDCGILKLLEDGDSVMADKGE